jgi:peptidoglycan/LPS O-acetylase OafA/YrhL
MQPSRQQQSTVSPLMADFYTDWSRSVAVTASRQVPSPDILLRGADLRTDSLGALSGRNNNLNLIRLVLASSVIVSHAWPLGQLGDELQLGQTSVGTIAVFCFFAISGFLITRSRERTSGGRYLWHRALRIFPGYAVCLAVIAAVIAPLAWLHYNGTIAGYPVIDALRYVGINATLLRTSIDPTIAGTQASINPSLQYWNGAAWSLFFEFLCYLGIALLAAVGLLRARIVAVLLLMVAATLLAWEIAPEPMTELLFRSRDAYRLFTTGAMFLAGSLLYFLRDRIPSSPGLAAGAAVVAATGLTFLEHPEWLIAPAIAYLCVWLGTNLPFRPVLLRTDISYGVYIYGYPVATLLTIYGASQWGVTVYLLLTFAIVAPLALLSWFVVERPALRAKDARVSLRRSPAVVVAPPHTDPRAS